MDVARAEAFLADRFGGDTSDVTPLSAGVWSRPSRFAAWITIT